MKGGCASVLSACESWVNGGHEIPATLVFVCDEEVGGEDGIQYLLSKNMISPMDCLIAEPTPVRNPCIGQKGLCRLEMKFEGSPAHGSLYPIVGVSAIMEVMTLLTYIQRLHEKNFPVDERFQELIIRSSEVLKKEFDIPHVGDVLKKLMYNPGVITGGEKSNIVAQHCNLELELRVPWGCSINELLDGIIAHAPHGKVIHQTTHEPSITDPGCSLVSATCAEVKRVYRGEVFPILQWAASDARHLRRAGFNVVEYGPGEISTLHAVNERIRIDSLEKASDIYQGILRHYTVKMDSH
jgi:succinyl-diaminopimelate desuccinylase